MPTADPHPVRVVSAAGFVTTLGGASLSHGVQSAMSKGASDNWSIAELQAWAGRYVAGVAEAEAAWITCGAAAGLALAAAACIAGDDPAKMALLPAPGELPGEILIQRGHRQSYDRAFRLAGATIKEFGYPYNEGIGLTYEWELSAGIGPDTVAVGYCTKAASTGLPLETVCEIAHHNGLPVVVDAAADLPPAENLQRFIAEGADLVAFSGGKAIAGPQASGLLIGREELIRSVRLQALDMDVDPTAWGESTDVPLPHHGLGRSMKVGKEEIFGLVAALTDFVERDHHEHRKELTKWLAEVQAQVGRGSVTVGTDSFYPRLIVQLDGISEARAVAKRLSGGDPRIIVPHAGLDRGQIVIQPEAVADAERSVVVKSLRECLNDLSRVSSKVAASGKPPIKREIDESIH